jgi:hypothetical protein
LGRRRFHLLLGGPFDPITPKAFRWDEGEQYGDDILGLEAPKLIKLFTVGAPESHPTLTDAKRFDIYRSILERATEEEAELLQAIVAARVLPRWLSTITKDLCEEAW